MKDYNKAIYEIEYGIKEIERYVKMEYIGIVKYASIELSFAYESLSEVYSQKGDYETAYALLEKSNKIKVK